MSDVHSVNHKRHRDLPAGHTLDECLRAALLPDDADCNYLAHTVDELASEVGKNNTDCQYVDFYDDHGMFWNAPNPHYRPEEGNA